MSTQKPKSELEQATVIITKYQAGIITDEVILDLPELGLVTSGSDEKDNVIPLKQNKPEPYYWLP